MLKYPQYRLGGHKSVIYLLVSLILRALHVIIDHKVSCFCDRHFNTINFNNYYENKN